MSARARAALALAALLVVPAACSQQQTSQAQRDANTAATTVRSGAATAEHAIDHGAQRFVPAAGAAAQNFAIASRIRARLFAIDAASAAAVHVDVARPEVRLDGPVRSAGLVSQFTAAARAVPGVQRVHATLRVDAQLQSPAQPARDLALAASVQASLALAAGTGALDVHTAASGDTVTLTGTAARDLRAKLEAAARGTPGVAHVADRLVDR